MATEVHIMRKTKKPYDTVLVTAKRFTKKQLTIKKDFAGKPYFENFKKLNFNLSHSRTRMAIAFSKLAVGVDIEKMVRRDFEKIVNRIGTANEIQKFKTAKNQKKYFYVLWTRKEAISKCIGTGLKYGFRKIDTDKWHVKSFETGHYIVSVASKDKKEKFKVLASSGISVSPVEL